MKKHKTFLVEDEDIALNGLKKLLLDFPDEIEIIGEAKDGLKALSQISKLRPEVLFLDIELPGLNGFEILRELDYAPYVIFTTAYDYFAIKAFEENAIDYLLKPLEKSRIEKSILRLQELKLSQCDFGLLFEKIENLRLSASNTSKLLPIKSPNKISFIKFCEISHFSADERYVKVHTVSTLSYLHTNSITSLEKILDNNFIRISRSVIVNSDHLLEIRKHFSGNYVLILNDKENTKIKTGKMYVKNLKERFKHLF